MKKIIVFLAPILIILLCWEIISNPQIAKFLYLKANIISQNEIQETAENISWIGLNSSLFPPPSKVVLSLKELVISGIIFTDLKASLWRLILGLILGCFSGVTIGMLTGRIDFIKKIFSPIIQLIRPLPPVAIIPLIIVWFGIGDGAKIFSIAFAVFFPVWINSHLGAQRISNVFLWSAQLLTKSNLKIFQKVIFPASLPFIVAGIRIGISIAFIMIFVSELTGSSSGLGYRISISHLSYHIDEMMAALFVLGLLGALSDFLFSQLINYFFPWLKFNNK